MGLATMGWRVRNILIIILLLSALLRLQGITNPYLDDQGWRQGDTASMAYNMLGHLDEYPEVFFPKLNYDGSGPQKVELEFPFMPYLLAWTWTIGGGGDIWGRLWAVAFSLLTILGVYKFSTSAFSARAGLWAGVIYGLMPLTIYYGRVVMPEPVAQAFSIWALASILIWREKPSWWRLLISSLLMAGAILGKLPQAHAFASSFTDRFLSFSRKSKIITLLLFLCSYGAYDILYLGPFRCPSCKPVCFRNYFLSGDGRNNFLP